MTQGRYSLHRLKPVLLLAFVFCCLPLFISDASAEITGMQFGQNFSCGGGGGGGGGGQFYTSGGCSGSPADGQVFSYFVCKFEEIINEALSKVYCAIVDEAYPAVMAALTMAVLFFGMMFLMGVSPFTAKELMMFAGKFAMVMAFATEAEYMIGIGYALFMNIAKEGIIIVLNYLFEASYSTANDVYRMFDDALKDIMQMASAESKDDGDCTNALFSLMAMAAIALPPVAMLGMYFMIKIVWVMVRAVFGYCQGILGVTFLVTLAPIYVSFALFKPTRALFEKWIEYLTSFSFQMVVVFAFLGMAFNIISKMADDIQSYTDLVKPYNRDVRQAPGSAGLLNMCGVCEMNKVAPDEKPSCKSNEAMEIGKLTQDENFLHFASVKILAMIIMFYILDIMLDFVPQMARHLAGPKYAAQLGGGDVGGQEEVDVSLPGEKRARQALMAGAQNFRGFTTPGAMISGFVAGGRQAMSGAIDDMVSTGAAGALAVLGGGALGYGTGRVMSRDGGDAGDSASSGKAQPTADGDASPTVPRYTPTGRTTEVDASATSIQAERVSREVAAKMASMRMGPSAGADVTSTDLSYASVTSELGEEQIHREVAAIMSSVNMPADPAARQQLMGEIIQALQMDPDLTQHERESVARYLNSYA